MDNANPVHTPGTPADLKTSDDSCLFSHSAKRDYQSTVGSLIFLVNSTQRDVAFATMRAARHVPSPREAHFAQLKPIFRYLRKRPALPLVYRKSSHFDLTCYSDASYASTKDNKSVTGSMVFVDGGLIHFGFQVQRVTEQSSSESEIIAINSSAKHGFYFSSLMGELG